MALLTLEQFLAIRGQVGPDETTQASLQAIISEVSDAILRYLKNGSIETASYTVIMDAPVSINLVLPVVPILASSLQLWFNYQAQGDPAAFTSANLLTAYSDYQLLTGPFNSTYSESGIVRNLWGAWGVSYMRPALSLASSLIATPGAIKATFTAGYSTVPPSIVQAAFLAATKLYNMRKTGMPFTNESLQAYSYGSQASATADGVIQGDPTIRSLLKPFGRQVFVGGYVASG
jgi:hypothetical protein